MSYVVQNFFDYNRKITLTPRIKFFFYYNNIEKFLFFIKFNNFLNFNLRNNWFYLSSLNLFNKYFFSLSFVKVLNSLNLVYVGYYTNNLIKSSLYGIFKTLAIVHDKKVTFLNNFIVESSYNFNLYLIPVKTLNIKTNRLVFKNVFFFYMFSIPLLWYQHTSLFRFYLNFIFTNYQLQTIRFYGGHFLRVYSF